MTSILGTGVSVGVCVGFSVAVGRGVDLGGISVGVDVGGSRVSVGVMRVGSDVTVGAGAHLDNKYPPRTVPPCLRKSRRVKPWGYG